MRDLDVLVVIPSMDSWKPKFGMSLCAMVANFSGKIEGYERQNLRMTDKTGSMLNQKREKALEQAIDKGCSHLMFIDTDQEFPPHTLRRLLKWGKPVVACNIAIKRIPSAPTARLKSDQLHGDPLFTERDSDGLIQVWRVGTGVMLIEVEAVKNLPKPWFPVKWKPDINDYQGEDWSFCELLEEHGIPIFVDQKLSYQIGHIGDQVYYHDHVPKKMIQTASKGDMLAATREYAKLVGEVER